MDCTCFFAKPAGLLGLSTFHGALCLKHAEARFPQASAFCPPVQPIFAQRRATNPQSDATRLQAVQEAAISSTQWSTVPPPQAFAHLTSLTQMKWDVARRVAAD